MRKLKNLVGDCPLTVHDKIAYTLNKLPNRHMKRRLNQRGVAAVVACTLLVFFGVVWTINPALAQGNSFRDAVVNFFGFNPSAKELIEPPLPAKGITALPKSATPGETAALTEPNDEGNQVPTIQAAGYIFELEDQVVYDGATLTVGYNVRRADGTLMPPEAEYTKDHVAGYIRAFDLTIDGELITGGDAQFDWSDPCVYRQICSYDLHDLEQSVTNESQIVLRVAVHEYGQTPQDTVTSFAELPFSVDTCHEDAAKSTTPVKSVFSRGDFTVELQPIVHSVKSTQITIHAYKEDDPGFGKRMDGRLSIAVRDMSGRTFPCPPNSSLASIGHGEDENGLTYLECIWYVDPTIELPDKFQLTFGSGDTNGGEGVSYEPIIIEFS